MNEVLSYRKFTVETHGAVSSIYGNNKSLTWMMGRNLRRSKAVH